MGVIGEIGFGLRVCVAVGNGAGAGVERARVGTLTVVGITSAAQAGIIV